MTIDLKPIRILSEQIVQLAAQAHGTSSDFTQACGDRAKDIVAHLDAIENQPTDRVSRPAISSINPKHLVDKQIPECLEIMKRRWPTDEHEEDEELGLIYDALVESAKYLASPKQESHQPDEMTLLKIIENAIDYTGHSDKLTYATERAILDGLRPYLRDTKRESSTRETENKKLRDGLKYAEEMILHGAGDLKSRVETALHIMADATNVIDDGAGDAL